MARWLALVAFLVFTPQAEAGLRFDGSAPSRPYQTWINETVKVDKPDGVLWLYEDSYCPACFIWQDPPEIHLGPGSRNQRVFYHELGHAYHYFHPSFQWAFYAKGWGGPGISQNELIAETYKACALGGKKYLGYGYWPDVTPKSFNSACWLLRKGA